MRWVAMAAVMALAGCAPTPATPNIEVEDAWVRLPAVPGRPAAAYFNIRNDVGAATLVKVDSPAARRAEMHESMTHGGMAGMAPLAQVVMPADSGVTFEPGGRHVMLYDLAPEVKAGGKITLRLFFKDDPTPATIDAKVVGAADPAPTAG